MSHTATGGFPIGFRLGPLSSWKGDLSGVSAWARDNGFSALDLGVVEGEAAKAVQDGGLRLGSVDLPQWQAMLSLDPSRRQEAVAQNAAHIEACSAAGPLNFFVVMLPEDPHAPPHEVFGAMVASYRDLAPVLEAHRARLVIEGWPGPGALCCTPESCRAFFEACPSPALGLNYDPSHLLRMHIDPLRFLKEFAARIYHVHAKDTELLDEARYEYGTEQKPLLHAPVAFGGPFWRYTLPGHGVMRWRRAFELLEGAGYGGCVSVELEDHFFNGQETTEKVGLVAARQFLQSC